MWMLLTSLALAGKWDGVNGDVVNHATINAPASALYEYLLDLHHFHALFPDDCMSRWEDGAQTSGFGASATLRYDIEAMHRKLTVNLKQGSPGRYLDFEHPGNKGFTSRWLFTEKEGATEVELNTGINPPPWPFKAYYFTVVKPEWERCQGEALKALARAVAP